MAVMLYFGSSRFVSKPIGCFSSSRNLIGILWFHVISALTCWRSRSHSRSEGENFLRSQFDFEVPQNPCTNISTKETNKGKILMSKLSKSCCNAPKVLHHKWYLRNNAANGCAITSLLCKAWLVCGIIENVSRS